MSIISEDEFASLVKVKRPAYIDDPSLIVKNCFDKLGYNTKPPKFFMENASECVENLRKLTWKSYLKQEKSFCKQMLNMLIDEKYLSGFSPKQAISWYIDTYPNHNYKLNLSNTQSRRSRAGKEFECIIERILAGANISFDSQGKVGKTKYRKTGLGKIVDIVCPGVIHYSLDKRNTALISAKTTLRERWAEVPEEMARTGAKEIFLATLDSSISGDLFAKLYDANVNIVTTENIKNKFYKDNNQVLTFEDLLLECYEIDSLWSQFSFAEVDKDQIKDILSSQYSKYSNDAFMVKYYECKMNELK